MKLCKDAVHFYAKHLLGENLYNKIELHLVFQEIYPKSKIYGYCEWMDTNHRSRDFMITMDKNLTKKTMLLALAHEVVHVKQYAKGELKDYLKSDKSKWLGKIVDLTDSDYWEQPWEIDAHGREKGLYVKFKEHLKKK